MFMTFSIIPDNWLKLLAMAHHTWNPECKVYVGGLSEDTSRYDLEDAFSKIGKVGQNSLIES